MVVSVFAILDTVEDTVQDQFCTVDEDVIEIGNVTLRHLHLILTSFMILTIQVKFRLYGQLVAAYQKPVTPRCRIC